MDYMREINAFYDWLITNPQVSDSARNLWFALMHTANRAGWANEFAVAISALEAKTGMSRPALYRARNTLKQAGRIIFSARGGNQCAVYTLVPLASQIETHLVAQSEHTPQHEADTLREHYSSYPPDTQKTKTKTKTNTKAEVPPLDAAGLPPLVSEALADWLRYKAEKRQMYRPTGLKALVTTVKKQTALHGDQAVADCIHASMSSNWQGIIWDRIAPPRPAVAAAPRTGEADDPYVCDD